MAQQQRAYPCTGFHRQRVKISTRLLHYSRRKTRYKNHDLLSEVAHLRLARYPFEMHYGTF